MSSFRLLLTRTNRFAGDASAAERQRPPLPQRKSATACAVQSSSSPAQTCTAMKQWVKRSKACELQMHAGKAQACAGVCCRLTKHICNSNTRKGRGETWGRRINGCGRALLRLSYLLQAKQHAANRCNKGNCHPCGCCSRQDLPCGWM